MKPTENLHELSARHGEDHTGLTSVAIDREHSTLRETAANFRKVQTQRFDKYHRVRIADHAPTPEDRQICQSIQRAIQLREKWLYNRVVPEWYSYPQPRHNDYSVFIPPPYDPFDPSLPPSSDHVCQWQDGVVQVFSDRRSVMRRESLFQGFSLEEFASDMDEILSIMNDPETRSFCYRRIMLLEERFNMYLILNENQERLAQIAVPHRDFYNVCKVDTHGMYLVNHSQFPAPTD